MQKGTTMTSIKHPISSGLLLTACCLLLCSGCNSQSAGSDGDLVKCARLIVGENAKLTKQLAERDARIQQLEERLKVVEAENAEHAALSKDTETLMQSLVDLSTKSEAAVEQLTAENESLKQQLQQFQQTLQPPQPQPN